jgi:hypothetical protein
VPVLQVAVATFIRAFSVLTGLELNLLDLLGHAVELAIESLRSLVQLHQLFHGAELELAFVDLREIG